MATRDKCCTLVPYFKIKSGNPEAFKEIFQNGSCQDMAFLKTLWESLLRAKI